MNEKDAEKIVNVATFIASLITLGVSAYGLYKAFRD
jgi:uncharacterized membrane protein YebE (DUF533 family)